ncbi:hypothetical protein KBC79_03590 [Candidatus Woesebacteria bacterium]|nr:hypothetical protein [Candidatus Woesebacteria bacterium]
MINESKRVHHSGQQPEKLMKVEVLSWKNMTIEELQALLTKHGIDLSGWDNARKGLPELHKEIANGEAELILHPEHGFVRRLKVLTIEVRHKNHDGSESMLFEDRQAWHEKIDDDTGMPRVDRRTEMNHISEKLAPGEISKNGQGVTPKAIARALKEELGVHSFEKPSFLGQHEEFDNHQSFPGLKSIYQLYRYRVYLPDSEKREEYIEAGKEKTTYFYWKEVNSHDQDTVS